MTPLLLGLLALCLAWPIPSVLARWPALRRTPRAAVVLWQGVALAAVLAALGAGLSMVTDRAWRHEPGPVGYVVALAAGALTLVVLGQLLLSGHRLGTSLRALRRAHREHVDLLARRDGGVLVLDHDLPLAYCLPGLSRSRVVVSRGALGRLTSDEFTAVLAHERAHLRARHDLVLEAFGVLHAAYPRWVSSRAALEEVRLLVEVLADRAAARVVGAPIVGRALVVLAEARTPPAGLGLAPASPGDSLVARVRLLEDLGPHRWQAAIVSAAGVAVVALPTFFLALPWLESLA
ncbi:M56 family metallopeptidase [Nocardioides sp.]|uniref:M56 family metallopeptidase n=1 Tax=Nocardioides sp. TaxID=35761 RepID=UPI003D099EDE